MPSFTFTSPEGKKYTVNGPEGSTKDQAFQMLQKQINAPTVRESAPVTDTYAKTAEEMPFMQQVAAGAGGAVQGSIIGLKQLFGMDVPEEQVKEYKQAMSGLRGTGGGVTGEVLGTLAQFIPAGAGVFRAASAVPRVGGAVANMATTAGGRAGLAASGGATQGAMIPVEEGENRLANIAGGAALAGGASRLVDAATAKVAARKVANALARKPQSADQMVNAQDAIAQASKKLSPQSADEIARLNTLQGLPVPITEQDVIRSQITRQYPQQEAERLIAGQPVIGGEVAQRLARGQEKMGQNIDVLAERTGAIAPTQEAAGETVRSWAQNMYGAAKKETQAAYDKAKMMHGDEITMPGDDIVESLVQNRAMPGYKELFAQAQNMGMITKNEAGLFEAGEITRAKFFTI